MVRTGQVAKKSSAANGNRTDGSTTTPKRLSEASTKRSSAFRKASIKKTPPSDATKIHVVKTVEQLTLLLRELSNIITKASKLAGLSNLDELTPAFVRLDYRSDSTDPAALTLLVEGMCIIVDFSVFPHTKLKVLITYLSSAPEIRVIAESSVVIATIMRLATPQGYQKTSLRMLRSYDLRLGFELVEGDYVSSLNQVANSLSMPFLSSAPKFPIREKSANSFFTKAFEMVSILDVLFSRCNKQKLSVWVRVSAALLEYSLKKNVPVSTIITAGVGFDSKTFVMGSQVLLSSQNKAIDTSQKATSEKEEARPLLALLPQKWATVLKAETRKRKLIDVEFDLERPPCAYFRSGPKRMLSDGPGDVVSQDSLSHIENSVAETGGSIGRDNRGGIRGTLHRISVIRRNDTEDIIGATIRAGRHVYGVASILYDLLLAERHVNHSILILGPPGSGKTTMIRDIARILSQMRRVLIVDSSNEIGGHGNVPHKSVGDARRMSVPGGKAGIVKTLVEAVENHSPEVVVVDELSCKEEVMGASTANLRGVRAIASAHGDLRSVIKNQQLNELVGGVRKVIISDVLAARDLENKLRDLRRVDPIFDVVVELGTASEDISACRVVRNASQAVDCVLSKQLYNCELRRRDIDGDIFVEPVKA